MFCNCKCPKYIRKNPADMNRHTRREMSANIRVLFVSYPVVLYVCRSSIFCHRLRCLLGALVLPTARLQLIVRTTALFSCHIRFRPLHTVFATGWQSGWRRGKTHVYRGLVSMIVVSATAPTASLRGNVLHSYDLRKIVLIK